jgi:hypothetical protein
LSLSEPEIKRKRKRTGSFSRERAGPLVGMKCPFFNSPFWGPGKKQIEQSKGRSPLSPSALLEVSELHVEISRGL